MADVKWIKLATGLPDNRKIKQIRKLPDGDTIALMWIFLMCLAGDTNDDGMVYFMPEIPYTDEMLAEQFNIDVNTVRLGLSTFQRFGMIEIVDDIICLSSWEKWQAVDKLSEMREKTRKRVAKHREKQKTLIAQRQCAYCGGAATGYDHIIATARGGADTEDNKVCCCIECNRIKNDKPLVSFLNDNRERIDDDLIASNPKLQRFVTLCNVTGRYIVTQSNAVEEDREEEIDTDKRKENIIVGVPAEQPKEKRSARKVFSPPTVEEVRKYCSERGNNVDPEVFVDFYESKGWMIGKSKMKDWKAAVRTWERSEGRKKGSVQVAANRRTDLDDIF